MHLINSILGLFATGLLLGLVTKIARAKGWVPERHVFGPIIEALEKIATGDFGIRVENEFGEHPMINELTNSVNKMVLELGQMETMRQEFISNVSHEIQSPLTSILGFAEALENDQLSQDNRHHYLDIIKSESIRLSKLSDDLLKLASLESETVKLDCKTYRLDEQLKNLILACEPQWIEKNIDIEVSLEEIKIIADENMLSQVWINLISNSIKYTPIDGNIRIEMKKQTHNIEISISDTGIGISEEDQLRIFERFYKTDKSRDRSKKGNGLGLSIVKKIIDMHQGTIHLNSQLGKGTTFTVTLPIN